MIENPVDDSAASVPDVGLARRPDCLKLVAELVTYERSDGGADVSKMLSFPSCFIIGVAFVGDIIELHHSDHKQDGIGRWIVMCVEQPVEKATSAKEIGVGFGNPAMIDHQDESSGPLPYPASRDLSMGIPCNTQSRKVNERRPTAQDGTRPRKSYFFDQWSEEPRGMVTKVREELSVLGWSSAAVGRPAARLFYYSGQPRDAGTVFLATHGSPNALPAHRLTETIREIGDFIVAGSGTCYHQMCYLAEL